MSSSKKQEKYRWTDWEWSEEEQLFVRELYDRQGQFVQSEFSQPQSVPRRTDDVDTLADDFRNLNPNEIYQEPGAGAYIHHAAAQTASSGGHDYAQVAPSKSASSKSKGNQGKSKSSSSKTPSSSASKSKSGKKGPNHPHEAASGEEPFYSGPPTDPYTTAPHNPYSTSHGAESTAQPPNLSYDHHGSGQAGQDQWYPDEAQVPGNYDTGHLDQESAGIHAASIDPNYYPDDRSATDEHVQSHHHGRSKGKGVAHSQAPSVSFGGAIDIPGTLHDEPDDDDEDPELRKVMEDSRRRYQSGGRHGQSSSQPPDDDYETNPQDYYSDDHAGEITPRAATPARKGAHEPTYAYDENPSPVPAHEEAYDPAYAYGDQPAAISQALGDHITGNLSTGTEEKLDPRFIIHPSHSFQPGEVFKVLWSEPTGTGKNAARMTDNEIRTSYGESFYVCFRRFVVVANDEGHCTCVPILTYERRGCTKKGVKAQKHGIVHASGQKPKLVENEPKLGFKPVRADLIKNEKLAPQSRINYSKLVTVEHNVKVFFVGSIIFNDFINIVSPAVDACWNQKKREHKRHHGNAGGH